MFCADDSKLAAGDGEKIAAMAATVDMASENDGNVMYLNGVIPPQSVMLGFC